MMGILMKKKLTREQYDVTQLKGTEAPFSGEYDQFFQEGEYHCVCCNALLFYSEDKYDAGCGWPSFTAPAQETAINENEDRSLTSRPRTEVICHACGAHLGHVFPDGPPEKTGLRYCINSVSLQWEKKSKK